MYRMPIELSMQNIIMNELPRIETGQFIVLTKHGQGVTVDLRCLSTWPMFIK